MNKLLVFFTYFTGYSIGVRVLVKRNRFARAVCVGDVVEPNGEHKNLNVLSCQVVFCNLDSTEGLREAVTRTRKALMSI